MAPPTVCSVFFREKVFIVGKHGKNKLTEGEEVSMKVKCAFNTSLVFLSLSQSTSLFLFSLDVLSRPHVFFPPYPVSLSLLSPATCVFCTLFSVQSGQRGLDMCVFNWPSDNTGCFLCTVGAERWALISEGSLRAEAPPVSISRDM